MGLSADQHRARASDYRRRERVAYAAFPGHWELLRKRWAQVADAFAIVAQDPEGIAKIEPVLTLLETKGWDRLVAALRAVLAGARDPEALAEAQSLDREDYLILTKLLGALPAPRLRRGRLTGGPGSEVVNNPRP